MTFPWEAVPYVVHPPVKLPWVRPELVKDPVTGLYPGQRHPDDIPDFLRRVRMPDGKIVVGLENTHRG